jgi:hypothetical protein
VASASEGESRVFRTGGISYLRVPAGDPAKTADFYRAVFSWSLAGTAEEPSFEDGTGHVIGHFVAEQPVAGEGGVRPYVYVDSIDDALAKVDEHGGEIDTQPYAEGDLWVATFRDPSGNVVGVWQRGPRP